MLLRSRRYMRHVDWAFLLAVLALAAMILSALLLSGQL